MTMKIINAKSLCLALVLALAWPLAVAAQDSDEASSPFAGGEGVVSGQVLNGSTGQAPPGELEVILRAFDAMDASFVDSITTTIAADGSFMFEGIDPSAPVQLEPLLVYQDVFYYGDLEAAITLTPEQPQFDVTITVYDSTQDDSAINIERLHIIFEFFLGQVQVVEIYILSNDGLQPYAGTPEGGTLRLNVPNEALFAQPEGDSGRYVTLDDGFADTAPVPPGAGAFESVLVYEMAYQDSLELSRPLPYDANQVIILVPDVGVEVSGEGIEPGGPFEMQDRTMQVYLANELSQGERLDLNLSGAAQVQAASSGMPAMPSSHPATTDETDETRNAIIALVVLAASLALAYLYWQGRLRLRPRTDQVDLYQAIADLDDDFDANLIEPKQYHAQRARLKQKLVKSLEDENRN
jgi:hypothetical protein